MRDFKYRDLLLGKPEWEEVVTKIAGLRSECLKQCAAAFVINLERTAAFGAMPVQIAHMVRRDQIFFDNAIFKVTGKGEIKLTDFSEEPSFEIKAEANRQMVEYCSKPDSERVGLAFTMGINYIESLIAAHPIMRDSAEVIFASIALSSWTAFETLASDLWAIGVDNGTPAIAAMVLSSSKLQKAEENLTPEMVANCEYNAKTHPGSFLREIGRVSFQKLESIKLYYAIAFGNSAKDIFDKTAGGYIYALAAVRNALTHRAGIADKKFVDQARKFDELKSIQLNQPILLDGKLVRKLRMAAAGVGADLLQHVDSLLAPA